MTLNRPTESSSAINRDRPTLVTTSITLNNNEN
jgi:hypothetical protein